MSHDVLTSSLDEQQDDVQVGLNLQHPLTESDSIIPSKIELPFAFAKRHGVLLLSYDTENATILYREPIKLQSL